MQTVASEGRRQRASSHVSAVRSLPKLRWYFFSITWKPFFCRRGAPRQALLWVHNINFLYLLWRSEPHAFTHQTRADPQPARRRFDQQQAQLGHRLRFRDQENRADDLRPVRPSSTVRVWRRSAGRISRRSRRPGPRTTRPSRTLGGASRPWRCTTQPRSPGWRGRSR